MQTTIQMFRKLEKVYQKTIRKFVYCNSTMWQVLFIPSTGLHSYVLHTINFCCKPSHVTACVCVCVAQYACNTIHNCFVCSVLLCWYVVCRCCCRHYNGVWRYCLLNRLSSQPYIHSDIHSHLLVFCVFFFVCWPASLLYINYCCFCCSISLNVAVCSSNAGAYKHIVVFYTVYFGFCLWMLLLYYVMLLLLLLWVYHQQLIKGTLCQSMDF